ncbi:glycosyltransferase [Amycolatopsis sp. NPDC059657]|uniref:glycosyltransferase n=1 Tax=Amycolatopsis sp. NPDC059657 TaxID=3346899 RepID=UPI0036717CFC
MKILMAHASAELYGSDRVFAESVQALRDAGHDVVVTLPQDGPLASALGDVTLCPVPVLRKAALRPSGLIGLLRETAASLRPMVRLIRTHRPDVVYVNTVTVPLWLPLARLSGARVLAHVHEAEDGVATPIRAALAAPLLAAHTVVVNSLATGEVLHRSLPALAARTRLIYNGVPGSPVTPVPGAGPRIVLVGRISPRKGTDVAVRALALLKRDGIDATLDLVGSIFPGYEWFAEEIDALIQAGNLAGSVRLSGFRDDVWDAYAHADVAIVPSRVEPFGNTAVEAQLAGVPVIVTDAQGLPETVDHGRRGAVVPAGDAEALAAELRKVFENLDVAKEKARLAAYEATGLFAPQRYRAEIVSLLSTLPRRRPRRARSSRG